MSYKPTLKDVRYTIEDEGLDYAMIHYSDWEEVKDEKFHELRNNYVESAKKLRKYIETNGKNS